MGIRESLTNHPPTPNQITQIEDLRALAIAYGECIERLLPSRERSIAITSLEESTMWAVKSIVLNGA